MTTTEKPTLRWGLRDAIPEDYKRAAWGARAIYPDDLLHDRQDVVHYAPDEPEHVQNLDRQMLTGWLNGDRWYMSPPGENPLALALKEARKLLPGEMKQVVLYEDRVGVIVGDARASHGYVYMAAWLK